ncbi:MAG: cyclic pyranopterin monophosphate synthase MoaC [Gemmatimonadales bacterium]|nr:cyclic pyranopterin monophosphate synthase MoaC [Gemmatimonadales bacterium]
MGMSHVDDRGQAHMVDVSAKAVTARMAAAEGSVRMSAEAFAAIRDNAVAKGDVLATARLAGIMGAKRTADLIPLCHPLGLDQVEVEVTLDEALPGVRVTGTARVTARTGVEMEAMTAVSMACLTVYDMAKAIDRTMEIGPIRLVAKSGGKSGEYRRPATDPKGGNR